MTLTFKNWISVAFFYPFFTLRVKCSLSLTFEFVNKILWFLVWPFNWILCQCIHIVPFVFDSRLHNIISKFWWILTLTFLPSFMTQLCKEIWKTCKWLTLHTGTCFFITAYCMVILLFALGTACCDIPALSDSPFWICRQLHVLDETYVMNQVRNN